MANHIEDATIMPSDMEKKQPNKIKDAQILRTEIKTIAQLFVNTSGKQMKMQKYTHNIRPQKKKSIQSAWHCLTATSKHSKTKFQDVWCIVQLNFSMKWQTQFKRVNM